MSSVHIMTLLKRHVLYKSRIDCVITLCADYQLPNCIDSGHMYFINIKDMHWVVLFKPAAGDFEYFDSCGQPRDPRLRKQDLTERVSVWNDLNLHKDVSDLNCSLYCVMYVYCKLVLCMSMYDSVQYILEKQIS